MLFRRARRSSEPPSAELLLERLASPDAELRLRAVEAVDPHEPPEGAALERCSALVDDGDPRVRRSAIDLLGRLSVISGVVFEARVGAAILARVRDEVAPVRAEAAATLALLLGGGDRDRRLGALRGLLEDRDPGVRAEAAAALGDLEDRSALSTLAYSMTADPEPEVRFECAFALANMKDRRARC